jgi:hypothetical protein
LGNFTQLTEIGLKPDGGEKVIPIVTGLVLVLLDVT